jgi:hypothetical protein
LSFFRQGQSVSAQSARCTSASVTTDIFDAPLQAAEWVWVTASGAAERRPTMLHDWTKRPVILARNTARGALIIREGLAVIRY